MVKHGTNLDLSLVKHGEDIGSGALSAFLRRLSFCFSRRHFRCCFCFVLGGSAKQVNKKESSMLKRALEGKKKVKRDQYMGFVCEYGKKGSPVRLAWNYIRTCDCKQFTFFSQGRFRKGEMDRGNRVWAEGRRGMGRSDYDQDSFQMSINPVHYAD